MSRAFPRAQTGLPRPQDALPLAGSRAVWWREMAAGEARRAPDAQERAAFSAAPAEICGLTLDRPRIMGILNVTPDSFSDGGRHFAHEDAVARARSMAAEADILDIGGESTRPGAREVPVAEEIARTAPVIRAIREAGIGTPISIDTRKAAVAAAALDAGADMVNDVTALRFDPEMAALVAERDVPVCLMHSVADARIARRGLARGGAGGAYPAGARHGRDATGPRAVVGAGGTGRRSGPWGVICSEPTGCGALPTPIR